MWKMICSKMLFIAVFVYTMMLQDQVLCGPSFNNPPFFTSEGKVYKEISGSTVTLACNVDNLGMSTVIWKQANRMISAGSEIIRKDDRLSLKGYNLIISNLKESDSGEYVCEIETYGSPLSQTSTLEILVPPSIKSLPSDGSLVVRKGSTVTLECQASGNPKPKISWHRVNNVLPSGEKSVDMQSIIIQDLSRHHSGAYICSASNGVGQTASAQINLKVLFPPEIEINQSWIRTGEGIQAEISCLVYAEPKEEVKWFKDTMVLDPTNVRLMTKYGDRYVLTLPISKPSDFGNYSCLAENSLGRHRGIVEVSGRPHVSKILSPSLSYYKDQYNLTWATDSFLQIEEYRILYRVSRPFYMHSYLSDGSQQDSFLQPIEWTNIIPTIDDLKPSSHFQNSFTYTASFNFYGLSPSTEYEVIIQSRNREGWSNASDIFKFSTRDKDFDPLELTSSDKQGFFSSASPISFTTIALISSVLFAIATL